MTKFKTLRHALLMTAAVVGGTVVAAVPDRPAFAQEAVRTYAIPAQDLDGALRAFAMQTGRDVLYPPRIVAGKRSPGVQGQRTERQALEALLAGTGLRFQQTASSGYVVQDPASPTRAGEAGDAAATELEDVVVTGTHIRGAAPIGSPLLVFTQEDFQNAGADTLQEFMATVVQNSGGAPNGDTWGRSNDLTHGAGLDLRGLGNGTTLVLLNGRRMPLSGAASYVDISMIPISAIERVDILTDGASAIYGADAVGGVVNIITRSHYVGGDTSISAAIPTRGGGEEYRVAQSFGADWGSGGALLSAEAYRIHAIGNDDVGYIFDDPNSVGSLISAGQERYSALGSLHQKLSEKVELFADVAWSERKANGDRTIPQFGIVFHQESVNTTLANSLGLNINLPREWSATLVASRSYAESEGSSTRRTNGVSNPPEIQLFSYETLSADASASGPLLNLPAGVVRAAFGVGYREDTYSAGGNWGVAVTPEDSFAETHAFAEFNIPLLGAPDWAAVPRLQLSLAGRYDDYDQFGSSLDPRVGLELLAAPGLKLRAAYSTSFRAPTLEQLSPSDNVLLERQPGFLATPVLEFYGIDPDLGPEVSRNWSAGVDWEPAAFSGLSISLGWYDISYRDRISTPPGVSLQQFVSDPAFAGLTLLRGEIPDADFNALVDYYRSGAAGRVISQCGPAQNQSCGPASGINYIIYRGLRTNLAGTHQSGLDLRLRQTFDAVAGGQLQFALDATYVFDLTRTLTEGSPPANGLNLFGEPVDLRMRGGVVWSNDKWVLAGYANYVGAHTNNLVTPFERIPASATFDATVRWDLGAGRQGVLAGVEAVFTVRNILDDLPPPVRYSAYHTYDSASNDPYGRTVSLTLTKSW